MRRDFNLNYELGILVKERELSNNEHENVTPLYSDGFLNQIGVFYKYSDSAITNIGSNTSTLDLCKE